MTRRDLALIAATRAQLADGSARTRREASGVTVGEIAETLGVTPQAVSQWELRKKRPNAANALGYAKILAAVTVPPLPR